MKFPKTKYFLEVDTQLSDGAILDTTELLAELGVTAQQVKKKMETIFSSAGNGADFFNRTVSRSLRNLRGDFQDMKEALAQAAAPMQSLLIPGLDQAINKITVLAQSIAVVLNTLLGLDTAKKKVEAVTGAEEALKKTSVSAGTAIKRSLAGFDQINRLGSGGGGGSSSRSTGTKTALPETVEDTLSPQVQAMVDKIMGFLEPLQNMNFIPLRKSLYFLGQALSDLGGVISESLQWAWLEVLVPLGSWVVREAAPATVGVLTEAFKSLALALVPVLTGITNVHTSLEPMTLFIQETVTLALDSLREQFQKLAQVFREKGVQIGLSFDAVGQAMTTLWGTMQPIMEKIRSLWLGVADILGSSISNAVSLTVSTLSGLVTFIGGAFSGNWSMAWGGLLTIFQGIVNGIIGMFNGLIGGVVSGINAIVGVLNQVKFKLPDWDVLGSLAGQSYSINLKTVSAPQIPYLAKGAVLPANKPFLAMVGDQRHGTNVEAPLTTIQEAVAVVMEDMIASNTAGQEMIVQVLKELLEAVMGIEVGDEVIGRAAQRYNRKMAVVKGGYV